MVQISVGITSLQEEVPIVNFVSAGQSVTVNSSPIPACSTHIVAMGTCSARIYDKYLGGWYLVSLYLTCQWVALGITFHSVSRHNDMEKSIAQKLCLILHVDLWIRK